MIDDRYTSDHFAISPTKLSNNANKPDADGKTFSAPEPESDAICFSAKFSN
jgi:hypothetical protein